MLLSTSTASRAATQANVRAGPVVAHATYQRCDGSSRRRRSQPRRCSSLTRWTSFRAADQRDFAVTQRGDRQDAAAVLLARPGFLIRLEEPSAAVPAEGSPPTRFSGGQSRQKASRFSSPSARGSASSQRIAPNSTRCRSRSGNLGRAVDRGRRRLLVPCLRQRRRRATRTICHRDSSDPRGLRRRNRRRASALQSCAPTERAPIVSSVPPIAATPQPYARYHRSACLGPNSAPAKAPDTPRATSSAATPDLVQPARAPKTTPPAAALAPPRDPAKQKPASPVATPAPALASRVPVPTPPLASPGPEEEQTTPQAPSRPTLPPPPPSPADQRLAPAESQRL
jgi:hypothetical protein